MLREFFNLLTEGAPALKQSLSSIYGFAAAPFGGVNATGSKPKTFEM
jgi:hypothetical protein